MSNRGKRVHFVAATEAAKNFGRLVDRVREDRVTYVVERAGTPVAQISPVVHARFRLSDFKALIRGAPPVDEEYVQAVEEAAGRRNRPHTRRNPWAR